MSAERPYRVIAVKDENGDELAVYDYWPARTSFGRVAQRRLKLPSGQQVVPVDDGSFMIAATGQRLRPVTVLPAISQAQQDPLVVLPDWGLLIISRFLKL